MGEEVKFNEYEHEINSDGDEDRVTEWENGLPDANDLTPLSQSLIPPELASAFSISPEPYKTLLDVNRASRTTVASLRNGNSQCGISSNSLKAYGENQSPDLDPMVIEEEEIDRDDSRSDSRKEEADSADDPLARTLKRPRLVWTPQLHKRFVDVVAHLGIKNAVPKTIMQMMNVEGLTRENVASHLQKYRLYLKRMRGLSNEAPSSSDQLFASTSVPKSFSESGNGNGNGNGKGNVPMQMAVPMAAMMPWMAMGNSVGGYHGFESHPFNMMQQRDWSGNK